LIYGKKDKIGTALFSFIYLMLFLFTYGVSSAKDEDLTSYLVFHKLLFYINALMTVWCHIKCFLTNPGKITHELNPHFIEFYSQIRGEAILKAIKFNETYGKYLFSQMKDVEDYDSNEFTDYDSFEYEAVTSIQNDVMEKVSKENNIKLKRCDRCYVVRVHGTRHCNKCQGCIMKMDHHCPWVFNCIGQFNQKFFIQFVAYSTWGIVEAMIISMYYIWYKDRAYFYESWSNMFFFVLMYILLIVFFIFDMCMVYDQWSSLGNEMTVIDLRKKKFLEKRTLGEVFLEIFGDSFGFHWFFPVRPGGFLRFFNKHVKPAEYTFNKNYDGDKKNN